MAPPDPVQYIALRRAQRKRDCRKEALLRLGPWMLAAILAFPLGHLLLPESTFAVRFFLGLIFGIIISHTLLGLIIAVRGIVRH